MRSKKHPPAPEQALTTATRDALAWYRTQATKARNEAKWYAHLAAGTGRSHLDPPPTLEQARQLAEDHSALAAAWEQLAAELEAFATERHLTLTGQETLL